MLKCIKKAMEEENKLFRKQQLKHYEREDFLMKQAKCIHQWLYLPDEPADSMCFAPEMPQRIKCPICNLEIWNTMSTHKEDRTVMKHILIDMDINIKPPLER